MNHEDANKILPQILGKETFKEMLDKNVDIADKKLGENHSAVFGIIMSHFNNMVVLYMAILMSEGYSIKEIERTLRSNYRDYIFQDSLEDFYIDYKKYIDKIILYINKRREGKMNDESIEKLMKRILGEKDFTRLASIALEEYKDTNMKISEFQNILNYYLSIIFAMGITDTELFGKNLNINLKKRKIKKNLGEIREEYKEFIEKVRTWKDKHKKK